MLFNRLLIANRGEISVRLARAAAELDISSLAVYSEDDAQSLHAHKADAAIALQGRGAAAYLDSAQLIAIAKEQGCDAIHPGYGFLSENADFARQCAAANITFIGPDASVLDAFGDKASARRLAIQHDVPILQGTNEPTSLEQAQAFMADLPEGGAVMLKALAGGGGRGMRAVYKPEELADAFERCSSEARAAFGNGDLYIERLITRARHIEVQIIGDGKTVSHLWERECTLQRRNQKLLEVAPAPGLDPLLRERLLAAAVTLTGALGYRGLCTVEFLIDEDSGEYVFMEANPRIQVEHTVTEACTGLDLAQLQIKLAAGATLADLDLEQSRIPAPRGHAVQLRINLESMQSDGSAQPTGGTLSAYEPPSGPGVRVDGYGYTGYTTNPAFDSLMAKLIVHSDVDYPAVLRRAYRALCEFRLEGVPSNLKFLQSLLQHPQVQSNEVTTAFIETHAAALISTGDTHPQRYPQHAASAQADAQRSAADAPAGSQALDAPVQGVLVSINVEAGESVVAGQQLAIMEAMKMEFVVKAQCSGVIHSLVAAPGDNLFAGDPLLFIEPTDSEMEAVSSEEQIDLDYLRADLQELNQRLDGLTDAQRPDAVARRRKTGQRTARENLADLLDEGSFMEYGGMALAAQRTRRSYEELLKMSPADGLIAGIGTVNAEHFGAHAARCMAMTYDYTVFAGTQGAMNHKKTDRMLDVAEQWQLPLVFFTEGGGGRPGDVDSIGVAGLDCTTFMRMARLSGQVPLVGVVSGRCFAGNAALLGCCDVIIATENATIGMAGPAMIEGGGLGTFTPEEVGPTSMHGPNGVVDVVVKDEAEATRVAKQYLSYFQGDLPSTEDCADQRLLRHLIPENRLRVYDIRQVIETLADTDSVLELRREFAPGMITALIRINGKPFGLMANNPMHLGGAIDAVGGDKASRFMQLCQAHGLPIVSLCDTPGFMVGPEAEQQATVRHVSRMFVTAASLSIPFFTIVLRKGYGLGAQAMAAGSFHAPMFTIGWPSSEFGAMGLEGAVRLGYSKELAAIEDEEERQAMYDKLVAGLYERGKGISMASFLEIDAVIDPVETRDWLLRGLSSAPAEALSKGTRPFVDTW